MNFAKVSLPLLLAVTTFVGCKDHDCPAIFIPGVAVTVTDAATGAFLCDAHVKIAKGSKDEATDEYPPPSGDGGTSEECEYRGGWEGGSYSVTVERDGYVSQTVASPDVPTGDCGITKTVKMQIALVKR
jgi:hypothetical protein